MSKEAWFAVVVWYDENVPCAAQPTKCGLNVGGGPLLASSLSVCNTVYSPDMPVGPIMQLSTQTVGMEPIARIHGYFARLPYLDDEDSDHCSILIASELEAPGGTPLEA